MAIPFIRRVPSGRRSCQEITRPPKIEEMAAEFIDHAGRFLIEILPSGQVHLMAIIDLAKGCTKVAEEFCDNGPDLPEAVDRLVTVAHPHIPIRILTPANTP